MVRMTALHLACLLQLLALIDARDKDERADVFYEKEAFYLQHPLKAAFAGGGYTDERFRFALRPIAASLAIPKNHLVIVTHQFQPWAKKIYDTASIVALLPDFEPRTHENSDRLMMSSSQDRLSIILGGLAGDESASEYREAVDKGWLVPDARSFVDVPVYRKSGDVGGTDPFVALPDPARFRSPLGHDIVIVCPPTPRQPGPSQYATGDCSVQIALPPSYFPRAAPESLGRDSGLRLRYSFNEKYLSQWPVLHQRVMDFVRGFIL